MNLQINLFMEVGDTYHGIFKTLKESWRRCSKIERLPCSYWDKYCQDGVYRHNATPIQFPMKKFKSSHSSYVNTKDTRYAIQFWTAKCTDRISIPDSKSHDRVIVIKTAWNRHKSRSSNQWNGSEDLHKNLHYYNHPGFDRGQIHTLGKRKHHSTNGHTG